MFERLSFAQQGTRVIVVKNGTLVMDLEWQAALEFGQALLATARKAEACAKAPRIIEDQAVIIRAGLAFPLTDDKKMIEAAMQESRWSRALRRYMPAKRKMPDKIGRLHVTK